MAALLHAGCVLPTLSRHLDKLRLHRVRQALIAAKPELTTVAAEALRWGFWHFGGFARAYRKCFGKLPSETLARNRGGAKQL
jgi:transcriptional regulator GlxA family with amidase domain